MFISSNGQAKKKVFNKHTHKYVVYSEGKVHPTTGYEGPE